MATGIRVLIWRCVCAGAAVLMAANAVPAPAAEIAVLPLERPETLGIRIGADSASKTDGDAAIRIVTQWPTVLNIGEVATGPVAPATLVFEADVRSEGLSGQAYLELWCHFPGQGQYFGRGVDSTVSGSGDWKRLRARFVLQAGQQPSKVTLNLVIQGAGTVWIDRARLLREPPP